MASQHGLCQQRKQAASRPISVLGPVFSVSNPRQPQKAAPTLIHGPLPHTVIKSLFARSQELRNHLYPCPTNALQSVVLNSARHHCSNSSSNCLCQTVECHPPRAAMPKPRPKTALVLFQMPILRCYTEDASTETRPVPRGFGTLTRSNHVNRCRPHAKTCRVVFLSTYRHRAWYSRRVANTYFVTLVATVGGILFGFDISFIAAIVTTGQYIDYFDNPSGVK